VHVGEGYLAELPARTAWNASRKASAAQAGLSESGAARTMVRSSRTGAEGGFTYE
jgi:hypothetical protein